MAGEKRAGTKISTQERRRERVKGKMGRYQAGISPRLDSDWVGLGFGRGISVLGWYRGTCASPTGYSRVRYLLATARTPKLLWWTVLHRVPGTRTGAQGLAEDPIQCKRSYGWSLQEPWSPCDAVSKCLFRLLFCTLLHSTYSLFFFFFFFLLAQIQKAHP